VSEFVAAGIGGLIVGGFSFLGVWWTLRKHGERDRRADQARLRDAKHERLHAAYRDVILAYEIAHHVAVLGLLEVATRRLDDRYYELSHRSWRASPVTSAKLQLACARKLRSIGPCSNLLGEVSILRPGFIGAWGFVSRRVSQCPLMSISGT
jgi:hypothetical protein